MLDLKRTRLKTQTSQKDFEKSLKKLKKKKEMTDHKAQWKDR